MTSFERQQHDPIEPQGLPSFDACELNSGFTPQTATTAWHQAGGGDDLSRSLAQVQQHEAWLQSLSTATLLDLSPAARPAAEPTITTTVLGEALGLSDLARTSLLAAQQGGLLDKAIGSAFDPLNQASVTDAVNAFLSGNQQPQIHWAQFESSSVRGAFISDSNTILISTSLRTAPAEALQSVLLEELGHWLEASSSVLADSAGDEGEMFAGLLLGTLAADENRSSGKFNDTATLLIDGNLRRAELSEMPRLSGSPVDLSNTTEDTPLSFETADLLAGYSDPDLCDQLLVQNLRVSSGNGRLAVDDTGRWTFTPEPNANSPVTLAYEIVDSHGDSIAVSKSFAIAAVNDPPRRIDDGPRALYVIEDAATTPLGLTDLVWTTGAERDPATDRLRQIANEAGQTLAFTITALPDTGLGVIGVLDGANGLVPVRAGDQLSLAQLQGLQFRPVADAYGSSSFTYTVDDGAGGSTSETFTIHVLAVNDAPVLTSPELAPLVIDNSQLRLDRNTGLYESVRLRLNNLLVTAGGDALEQASQTLLYRILQLPDAAMGQVLLANGAVVVNGTTYSIEQLRELIFRPARGVERLAAAQRLGELRIEAADVAAVSGEAGRSTTLRLPILVDTNKAAARAGVRIAGLTSDEQAIQAVLALDPSNPGTGFVDPSDGSSGESGGRFAPGLAKGLNPALYSQLASDNPLYLAAIGGLTVLDGKEVNYTPSAVPFVFDLPLNSLDPNSWTNGGSAPSHTLIYRSTLSGQLRSNDALSYKIDGGMPKGFTLSESGAWTFDPLDPAYADLVAVGSRQELTIRYLAGGARREFTLEIVRRANTVVAQVIGNAGSMTTSRGDWIAANPEGRDKDRYFKYISEYVLSSYGARFTGARDESGNKIYAWDDPIRTADAQPLRLLDGTVITKPGYYDFTRRNGAGDGAEFIYETMPEKGKFVDYIIGIRFFLRNNVYGDNDPSLDNIRDPGAPVSILRELGVVTTPTEVQSSNTLSASTLSSIGLSLDLSESLSAAAISANASLESLADLPENFNIRAIVHRSDVLLSANTSPTSGASLPALGTTLTLASDGVAEEAGVESTAAGSRRGGPGEGAGVVDAPPQRGLRLDPIQKSSILASAITAPDGLLEQLSETNLLGANLLDSLALGAGLLYLLYGPKMMDQGSRGLRGWLAGSGWRSRVMPVPQQQLMALLLTRESDGSLRLLAVRISQNGLTLLAQQEVETTPNNVVKIEHAWFALLDDLQQHHHIQSDTLLLDTRLESRLTVAGAAAIAPLASLAKKRVPLATTELSAAVAAGTAAELETLRAWLNKPAGPLPADSPIAVVLERRCVHHQLVMPAEQAMMVGMVELSLALSWAER